jgi:hypothetical protein
VYLAQKRVEGRIRYVIRQSVRRDGHYVSRDLLDLGNDPALFLVYPGGNAFYIDPVVTESLESSGAEASDAELENLFWRFIRPDIRRALEAFRHREERSRESRRKPSPNRSTGRCHIFDRRRIHFLKFGQIRQHGLDRLPPRLLRFLHRSSRDEIEQKFIEMERVLRPTEVKAYVYAIFDLQQFFPQGFARHSPEFLDPTEVDRRLVKELCRLNRDPLFWDGMATEDIPHEYLRRYLFMHFDYDFAPRSFMAEYLQDFINRRREYRMPARPGNVSIDEAGRLFAETPETLKNMSRKDLVRLYRRRALKLHPDTGGDHRQFLKLSEAFQALLHRKRSS